VLNVLRHTYAVANKKLISKPPDDDKRNPRERFSDLASKIFAVPKSEIDAREKTWRRNKAKRWLTSRS